MLPMKKNKPFNILSIDVGITNMGVCILHYDQEDDCPFVIEHWEKVNLGERMSHSLSIYEATEKMVEKFQKRDYIYQVNHIVIESQVMSTDKIQCMAAAIHSHFITMKKTLKLGYNISFSTGSVKTKVYEGAATWKEFKIKDKYLYNKKLGTLHTRAILEQNEQRNAKWIAWYKKQEKKDDLSDAFLQGAHFLKQMYKPKKNVPKRPKQLSPPESEPICSLCISSSDDEGIVRERQGCSSCDDDDEF